jgi:hypothetical protein
VEKKWNKNKQKRKREVQEWEKKESVCLKQKKECAQVQLVFRVYLHPLAGDRLAHCVCLVGKKKKMSTKKKTNNINEKRKKKKKNKLYLNRDFSSVNSLVFHAFVGILCISFIFKLNESVPARKKNCEHKLQPPRRKRRRRKKGRRRVKTAGEREQTPKRK